MLERLLPSYTADRRQTPWTLQLFIFSSLFTSSSDFRRNALTRASHPIVLPLCVSIFMTGGFPFLMLIYLFFIVLRVTVYSMDLHFYQHSLPTLVSTSIMFLSCRTSLSAFPFVSNHLTRNLIDTISNPEVSRSRIKIPKKRNQIEHYSAYGLCSWKKSMGRRRIRRRRRG